MSNLNTFIHAIKQKDNPTEIELELKLLFDKQYNSGKLVDVKISETDAKHIFKNLFLQLQATYKLREQQSVNLISKEGINKQILYIGGIKQPDSAIIYSKSRIADHYLSHNKNTWKVKACREHKLPKYEDHRTNYNVIRFKRRFSAEISPEWRIDYTYVIQLPYHSPDATIIDARDKLFLIEDYRVHESADTVEVEIEYIGQLSELTTKSLDAALCLFPNISLPNVDMYDRAIDRLKLMFPERTLRNERRISIKQLLPQTANLSKKQYMNIVINEEKSAEFYISHKLDGERIILFIDNMQDHQIAGYLTTDKWHSLETTNPPSNSLFNSTTDVCTPVIQIKSAILDCELYRNTLYVFDILECHFLPDISAVNIVHVAAYMCPYLIRRAFINQLQPTLESIYFKKIDITVPSASNLSPLLSIRIKPSFKLGASYQSGITTLLTEVTDYPRDGIIFTSARDPYLATQYFKWKPPTNMTIEFIAKKCPSDVLGTPPYSRRRGKTLYLLHVGIRTDMARAFGIRRLQMYHMLFPIQYRRDYSPIHFAPSNSALAYLYWGDRADLDNLVIEMVWRTDAWHLVKVRPDRQSDYLNNQYFGNDYYVAESIWNSYHNPFTADFLCKSPPELKREFYFVDDDSTEFRSIRKFNNWVKHKLLELCGMQPWLLDIGAGKGQDFMKYIQLNIPNVIFADVNINNIDEIIARKYTYHKQGQFRKASMVVHTICSDVLSPDFEKMVTQYTPCCKLIVCNFAIHYMCHNMSTAELFAKRIASLLPSGGGRLLITYLNGRKVFDICDMQSEDNSCREWVSGKYHIRANFIEECFTGIDQQIQIKLPFSDGFYSEYLFDPALLTRALRPHKIIPEIDGEFVEFIEQFQTEKTNLVLDTTDMKYLKLLDYVIYHKK